ncbi:MAG: calcium-binding protein [Geminicoccaceae bacterium]
MPRAPRRCHLDGLAPSVRNDVIAGDGGANFLAGWAGNDLIRGLAGSDTINAGPGSDYLDGGSGNNRLNGAAGVDIVTFAFSSGPVTVDLVAGKARRGGETDRLSSIEGAVGTAAADRLTGDEHDNYFQGRLGSDRLTGGAGRDTFYYDRVRDSPPGAGKRDVIADFTPGEDVLDLARIDADATAPGLQSFRWVGNAPLGGPGQVGYVVVGGNTIVRASTDADPQPELEIELLGEKALPGVDVRP